MIENKFDDNHSIKCVQCGVKKKRVFSHLAKSGSRLWRSPEGKLWNGRKCAECTLFNLNNFSRQGIAVKGKDHYKTCKVCGEKKLRRYGGKKTNHPGNVWLDEKTKNRWGGLTCPQCKWQADNRNNGHRPIDEVEFHSKKLGRESEKIAARYFESMGFKSKLGNGMGVDLVLSLGERHFANVEVKTVTIKKYKNKQEQYAVGRVTKKRREDDLIAFVFNDGGVFVQSMKSHLPKCSPTGGRNLSKKNGEHLKRGISYNG